MEWISFHGPRRPINGQKIIYYGEAIGVWRGVYKINYEDKFCLRTCVHVDCILCVCVDVACRACCAFCESCE